MKSLTYLASFAVITVALSLSAFGRDKDKDKDKTEGNFNLLEPAQVGSVTLQPGDYKAQWSGSGDAVKVEIMRGGKTVATADGKLTQLPQRASTDAVVLNNLNDSSRTIDEIEFNHRTEALLLGGQ
jgi:hypothetical protein